MDKARNVALKVLYKIDKEKAYSNIELNHELNKNRERLNDKDIGLISEIVYGVTTWKLTLDEIIKKYSNIKLKKISSWIINILRMGIYQIVFLDKVPKSAAVNESVNLAKKYGHKASSNFVNAILRRVEKSDYEDLFKIENDVEKISKTTSMPEWIVKKLLEEMPLEKVQQICKSSNLKAKVSARINCLKTSKLELKNKLNNMAEDGLIPNFLYLNNIKNLENLKEFREGLFTVQDEVASLPCLILDPKENENVLDACSAPGGKTTYLAELMKNTGRIDAWDIHEHRTKLVEENAKRLGITNIKTSVKDASIYDEKYFEKFDKILLDVPCLGLGVLKRKPDIKWQKDEKDIKQITKLQFEILQNCLKYLKQGGTLVYSTCSILKDENENIVDKVARNCNAKIVPIELPKENYFKKFECGEYLKVYQDEKVDGFFIAKIQK